MKTLVIVIIVLIGLLDFCLVVACSKMERQYEIYENEKQREKAGDQS